MLIVKSFLVSKAIKFRRAVERYKTLKTLKVSANHSPFIKTKVRTIPNIKILIQFA